MRRQSKIYKNIIATHDKVKELSYTKVGDVFKCDVKTTDDGNKNYTVDNIILPSSGRTTDIKCEFSEIEVHKIYNPERDTTTKFHTTGILRILECDER